MVPEINYNRDFLLPIVDTLLLDAFALPSSGLYNGRSGVALALGSVAKQWDDDYIYGQYITLLKTSLVSQSSDLSFSHGALGIGWALMVSILDGLVEADYHELMGAQHSKIIEYKRYCTVSNKQQYLFIVNFCYYLSLLDEIEGRSSTEQQIHQFTILLRRFLIEQLSQWYRSSPTSRSSVINNALIKECLEAYARLCFHFRLKLDKHLEDMLFKVYRKGTLVLNLQTLLYLCECSETLELKAIFSRAITQFTTAQYLYPWLTLSEYIDTLVCLKQASEDQMKDLITVFEQNIGVGASRDNLEMKLRTLIPEWALRCGYQYGLSRYLLYMLGCNAPYMYARYFT